MVTFEANTFKHSRAAEIAWFTGRRFENNKGRKKKKKEKLTSLLFKKKWLVRASKHSLMSGEFLSERESRERKKEMKMKKKKKKKKKKN